MSTNLAANVLGDAFLSDSNSEDVVYPSRDEESLMSLVVPEREYYAILLSDLSLALPKREYRESLPFNSTGFPKTFFSNRSLAVITELPVDGYTLLKPIPVLLEREDDGTWIAQFEEANISMSGNSSESAKEALTYDIVDALELFLEEEEKLIPKLKEYLNTLRKYIREQ